MLARVARKTNAELQAELENMRARLERAETARREAQAKADAATLVQWSARIPKSLRDRVHAARGELAAQDVTAAALELWLDRNETAG